MEKNKPDIASFTHFAGSGVYAADGGTSAATPVAAGVVAAIRRVYPASVLSPAELRDLLRATAKQQGSDKFNYEYGYGVIDVASLLAALEKQFGGNGTVSHATRGREAAAKPAAARPASTKPARAKPAAAKSGGGRRKKQ